MFQAFLLLELGSVILRYHFLSYHLDLFCFLCGTSRNYPQVEDNFRCFLNGYCLEFTLGMQELCPIVISCACMLFKLSLT